MHTLILDTSGRFTTVVLVRDGEAIACASYELQPLSHLHSTIRETLRRLELTLADVDRLAVVTGPGSWTGLNIGVTAAKTLAQVTGLPLIELRSLDALVAARCWLTGPVYAILDAKRGNVYCGAYATDDRGAVEIQPVELELIAWGELSSRLAESDGRPLVVEYGAVLGDRIERDLPRACVVSRNRLSSAGLTRTLRANQDRQLVGDDVLALAPLYLQKALGA